MKRKIRWIQIGVGHDHALETLNAALALQEDFEVLGAVITEEDRRDYPEKAAAAAKLCKVLTIEQAEKLRPEAAAIETEDEYLAKYGVLCAKKGWHLHVDKPAATNAEDFAALFGAVRESGVALQTGYMYRYNPAICRAIEKIESGALGEIYAIEAQMSCLHPEEKRRWLKKYQGGMTMYLGCHLIDILYRVQGEPLEVLPMNTSSGFGKGVGADEGFVLYRYPRGISFIRTTAVECGGFMRRRIVFYGEKGTIAVDPVERYDPAYPSLSSDYGEISLEDCRKIGWGAEATKVKSARFDRYKPMLADFASIVRGEKQSGYSLDYEEKLFNLIQKSGKEI